MSVSLHFLDVGVYGLIEILFVAFSAFSRYLIMKLETKTLKVVDKFARLKRWELMSTTLCPRDIIF